MRTYTISRGLNYEARQANVNYGESQCPREKQMKVRRNKTKQTKNKTNLIKRNLISMKEKGI